MAVCPFCLPWPRTSVTVMPEMPILSSASFTSSTLFGRTMHLMSFIAFLQHSLQAGRHFQLLRLGQLAARLGDVKHVDGPVAFGGNQNEVDVAPVQGHDAADPIKETQRVGGNDIDDRVALGRCVVAADDRCDMQRSSMKQAPLAAAEALRDRRTARYDVVQHPEH